MCFQLTRHVCFALSWQQEPSDLQKEGKEIANKKIFTYHGQSPIPVQTCTASQFLPHISWLKFNDCFIETLRSFTGRDKDHFYSVLYFCTHLVLGGLSNSPIEKSKTDLYIEQDDGSIVGRE